MLEHNGDLRANGRRDGWAQRAKREWRRRSGAEGDSERDQRSEVSREHFLRRSSSVDGAKEASRAGPDLVLLASEVSEIA